MRFVPRIFLAIFILAGALFAGDWSDNTTPPDPKSQKLLADFKTRVAYAVIRGHAKILTIKDARVTCEIFTVNHGDGDSPGYTLVIVFGLKDDFQGGGKIMVLCDQVSTDPKTGVVCSGHVTASQQGLLLSVDKDTPVQIGPDGAVIKYIPPAKNPNAAK